MFNVSFIFTAVPLATSRNWSACHVLLLQDKGSSSLYLDSETSRDKGSWVSVFSPLLFFTNLAKCFSTCTAQLKRLPMPCTFEKSKQTHHLVLQGWDCWGPNTGSLLNSPCYCGFVSPSQGALGLVEIVVHPHHQMPAWVCHCQLSQTPKVQHWHMAANPLLQDPHLPCSWSLLSHISNHSIKYSFLQQILGDFSERFSCCLKKLPCSLTFNKAIRKKKGMNNIKQHSYSLGS